MIIEIKNISKRFKRKQVLKNVSFTAENGICVGLLGANGSGKSTLLNILAGVAQCDNGEFLCDGESLLKNTKLRSKKVGFIPQGTPLIEELTAYDNLLMWYKKADLTRELESGVLNMLGINEFLKTPVAKMSGGMKKRLSIGCAVAGNPEILLLDEPTAALDLICKESISAYLESFKANGGIVVIATHDVKELGLCEKLFILKEGSLKTYDFDGNVQRLVSSL